MPDIHDEIAALAAEYIRGDDGRKKVEKAVGEAIDAAVRNATGYSSEFRKKLDAAVQAKLNVGFDFDIALYHDHLSKVVTRIVRAGLNAAISAQVEERLKEIIRPLPAEVKLSELVEEYRKELLNDRAAGDDVDDSFTARIDDESGGFVYLSLDKRRHTERYKCEVRLGVYAGKMFSLDFGDRRIENELFVGNAHGFERYLVQLRANGTKIITDLDAVRQIDTYIGQPDEEDS